MSETTEGPVITPSDLKAPNMVDPMVGVTVEERFSRIAGVISARVDSARRSAGIVADSELTVEGGETGGFSPNASIDALISGFRVWGDTVSPETLILTLEARLFANERVMTALTAQLMEHVVLGEDMRSQLAAARDQLVREGDMTPPGMGKFMQRLIAAGVIGRDVRFVPRRRMEEVLAAIWGTTAGAVRDRMAGMPDSLLGVSGDDAGDGAGGRTEDRSDLGDRTGGSVPASGVRYRGVNDSETGGPDTINAHDSGRGDGVSDDSDRRVLEPAGLVSDDAIVDAIAAPLDVVAGPVLGPKSASIAEPVPPASAIIAEPVPPASATVVELVPPAPTASTWPSNPRGFPLQSGQAVIDPAQPAAPSSREVMIGTSLVLPSIEPVSIAQTGYVLVEWMPFNERDLEARKFRVPGAASMVELALPGSEEDRAARLAEERGDPAQARRFVELHAARNGWTLVEEEVRLWLFVLHEARLAGAGGGRSSQLLGGGGWYDGVRLPPAPRQAKVRALRRVEQGDLGRAASVEELRRVVSAG